MNDIEDTIELYEAKEKAYNEGMWNGFWLGFPLGTLITLAMLYFTVDAWLVYIK